MAKETSGVGRVSDKLPLATLNDVGRQNQESKAEELKRRWPCWGSEGDSGWRTVRCLNQRQMD